MQRNTGIQILDQLPPDLSWADKVAVIAHRFLQLDQTATGLRHLFEEGKYIREIAVPGGTWIIGGIHKIGHEMQLLKGQVVLFGPDGFSMGFQAPYSLHTGPGYQAVCLTLTDVLARTIHPNPTEERDVQKLESLFFEPTEAMLALGKQIDKRLLQ